jgi:hypothetical protein
MNSRRFAFPSRREILRIEVPKWRGVIAKAGIKPV